MKNLAILLTVSLIAAAAAYFAFVSGGIDEMTLIVDEGRATIQRGGEQIRVGDSAQLQEGDLIRSSGSATLRLVGGRMAFLEGRTSVSVTNDRALDGQGGSLRAQSTLGDQFRVTFGDVAADATNSNFRVDQGVGSTRVGTYGGLVRLSTPGEPDLQVPQYFEAAIAVGDLPEKARPYRFDDGDYWDKQFLLPVMTLDNDLTSTVGGLSENLGGARPPLGYFDGLTDSKVDFMRRYLKRSTEELLIGFTIAENAREDSFEDAFTRAFRLRDDGGRWGIVAWIIPTREQLVAQLEDLVVGTGVADGGEEGADTPVFASGDTAGPGGGSDPSDPSDPTDPPGNDPTDPKDPKDPKDPDEEPPDCSSGPECDFQDAQDELDEILPDDDPSPTPEEDGNPLTDGVIGGGEGLP
jgi:hypothetical protein